MALRFLVLSMLLAVAGCATSPAPSPWPYPEPPRPADSGSSQAPGDDVAAIQAPQAQESAARLPAVQSLIDQARIERNTGELEAAAATLERGLRIDGREPLAWYELARIRFEQGNLNQADNLAHRALSFAESGSVLASRIWLLVEDIRKLQGDDAGAARAREQARGGGA